MTSERAVVIGCGIAGMAAAAALSPFCDEVLVLERDSLPGGPARRRGVPQSDQLHDLLTRAQVHLEHLFPGFGEALQDAGGRSARVADQTHVYELGDRMPERDLGLHLVCARRPVIEQVTRSLLLAGDSGGRVRIRPGTQVVGLRLSRSGALCGVDANEGGEALKISAGIVVDASGASSRAPLWLAATGAEIPKTQTVHHDQWYVTSVFERPDGADDPSFWLTFPTPPRSRGGLISPLEAKHWCVSLSGRSPDKPPRTVHEVRGFARALEDQAIATLIESARAVSGPHKFIKTVAVWRHYERLERPLAGFVPIGDALAHLNPVFGQGMSVAAWQASELAAALERYGASLDARANMTAHYLARASGAVDAAWSLGQTINGVLYTSDNERQRMVRLLHEDPRLHRLYVRVWHLMEPVSVLGTADGRARLSRASGPLAEVS